MQNLSKLILFSFELPPDYDESFGTFPLSCAFWNETAEQWQTDGCEAPVVHLRVTGGG